MRFLPLVPILALAHVIDSPSPVAASSGASRSAVRLIAIQPLGIVDSLVVRAVAERVRSLYAARVVVLPSRSLPRAAFYPPRHRYRGERVLDALEAGNSGRYDRVLGVMSRDLSVTRGAVFDYGIIGVACYDRPAAVVSVHRLRRRGATPDRVAQRARQVAAHELGHTFGLHHCPAPGCIMNDARGGIGPVDDSSGRFCDACRVRLASALRPEATESQGPLAANRP